MHLKNYSVINRNDIVELSPAWDLLNSSIVLTGDIEEIALPLSHEFIPTHDPLTGLREAKSVCDV